VHWWRNVSSVGHCPAATAVFAIAPTRSATARRTIDLKKARLWT
jgi:hypothetical protein